MPLTPTPGVNGHVVGSPALQRSRSMLSLAPAARTFGTYWLTASPGSFCLLCEKYRSSLPTVTSVSTVAAVATRGTRVRPSERATAVRADLLMATSDPEWSPRSPTLGVPFGNATPARAAPLREAPDKLVWVHRTIRGDGG